MAYCKNCGYELPQSAVYCPRCGTAVVKEEVPAAAAAPPSAPAPPVEPMATGVTLAWWWERFVAWLIDVVIVNLVMGLVFGFAGLLAFLGGQPFTLAALSDWFPFIGINGVVIFFYWWFMEAANGQSVGKMVMRMKVTRVDGGRISVGEAAIESIGKAFLPLLLLDMLLGWILYPRRRQRLFNYISQTIVVKQT